MDAAAYASMRDLQKEHWWFVGRREFLRQLIARKINPPADAKIFEAGCGFGGNLPLLEQFGQVGAFEYDAGARAYAASQSGIAVLPGALPNGIDIKGRDYDLIALLDVLEHIDDDQSSLETLGEGLADDGRMLVTVPAYQWLWSKHDELHHHKRRYTRGGLEKVVQAAGLEVEDAGYFNSLLFPLAVAQRFATRIASGEARADELPSGLVNGALSSIFKAEAGLASRFALPFGLSLYAIISRKAG